MTERSVIGDALRKGKVEGEAIGLEKGESIGIEKGKIEGKIEEKIDVVLNSHRAGIPIETIAIITDLTSEEITEILKQHDLL